MKKGIFVAIAFLTTSALFAQQKKIKQLPPPPSPPMVEMKEPPLPPPPPKPLHPSTIMSMQNEQTFLKQNPSVKSIHWSNDKIHVYLKSGQKEDYDLNSEEDKNRFKNKYG